MALLASALACVCCASVRVCIIVVRNCRFRCLSWCAPAASWPNPAFAHGTRQRISSSCGDDGDAEDGDDDDVNGDSSPWHHHHHPLCVCGSVCSWHHVQAAHKARARALAPRKEKFDKSIDELIEAIDAALASINDALASLPPQ